MTTVQGTEYDFSQGRDSTINNFILVRDLNDFNNLTITTMIFVVRYSDNVNNLTVNFLPDRELKDAVMTARGGEGYCVNYCTPTHGQHR